MPFLLSLSFLLYTLLKMPLIPILDHASGAVRNDRPEKRLLTKCAGTLGYMAPEVFAARPYDGRSADLFSIGAVLHHLIVPWFDHVLVALHVRWACHREDPRM